MKDKTTIASVRPSPLASILGIVGMIAMLIFGISFMSDAPEGAGIFMLFWALVCIAGIVYFFVNLASFSKSSTNKIPLTSDEVIEIVSEKDEAGSGDFEARLRKLESLRKDGLINEEEHEHKRKEIMEEKW